MYSKIIKNFIFPLYQLKLPQNERLTTNMNLLEKNQNLSYSELKQFQIKKLRKLLIYTNNNVPFYHDLFKDLNFNPVTVTSPEDISRLPILTKDIIKSHFKELCSTNISKNNLTLTSTSGSTGEPMKFYITSYWRACNMAAAYRSWGWAGYNLGDKMVYLWGATQDLNHNTMNDKIRNTLLRITKLNTNPLTKEKMDDHLRILRKFKPKIINSYSSAAYTLSKYMNEEGIDDIEPTAVLTTGDMLYENRRKSIEQAFNTEIYDYYSGRDTSLQAAECSEHHGYHLSIENAVVEFIKDDEPVSPGEMGNIVITDLNNYAMPFIRYKIGDLGVPSDEICPCGINLPLMKSVKGRIFDRIITPDGKIFTGEYFHCSIIKNNVQSIKEFQIIQKTKDHIILMIVKNGNEKKDDIDRFIKSIKESLGETVQIEVEYTSQIKRTKSGKLRHIISNIKE